MMRDMAQRAWSPCAEASASAPTRSPRPRTWACVDPVRPKAAARDRKGIVSFVVDRDRAIGQRAQEVYERLLAHWFDDRGPELLTQVDARGHRQGGCTCWTSIFSHGAATGGYPAALEALATCADAHWEGLLAMV